VWTAPEGSPGQRATSIGAAPIALCLFLVLMFGYPFSGELTVSPDSFKITRAIISYQAGRTPLPVP
jgi:hypothetical protein